MSDCVDQNKPKRRRITKTRVLTENKYYDMLKEKDLKEKQELEAKEKRKKEREDRKKENEEKKKKKAEEIAKKKGKEKQKKKVSSDGKKKRGRKRDVSEIMSTSEEEEVEGITPRDGPSTSRVSEEEEEDTTHRERPLTSRAGRLPSRFRDTSSSDDDSDGSGILCDLCGEREPANYDGKFVFWVDCDKCGSWFHTVCSGSSKKYVCSSCK